MGRAYTTEPDEPEVEESEQDREARRQRGYDNLLVAIDTGEWPDGDGDEDEDEDGD